LRELQGAQGIARREAMGIQGHVKELGGTPPGCCKASWSSSPSFWLFLGLLGTLLADSETLVSWRFEVDKPF